MEQIHNQLNVRSIKTVRQQRLAEVDDIILLFERQSISKE